MDNIPDALFIIDINKEKNALKEAKKLNIITFAIIDTNSNPELVDYIIPINDDSKKSIDLCLNYISNKIKI